MLTPDDIVNQQELLDIYRRNLDHLLEQAAQYGGEQFAPLHVVNSIAEARENILRIKVTLHAGNIAVDDKPDDVEPPEILDTTLPQSARRQITQAPTMDALLVHPRTTSVPGNRRCLWVVLTGLAGILASVACIVFFGALIQNRMQATGVSSPTNPADERTSGSNQPRPTPVSLDATSPNDPALPAPVFPTTQPTPPPVSALLVSNTPGRSTSVQIAVDAAGVIHVVWLDNTPRQGRSGTVLGSSGFPVKAPK